MGKKSFRRRHYSYAPLGLKEILRGIFVGGFWLIVGLISLYAYGAVFYLVRWCYRLIEPLLILAYEYWYATLGFIIFIVLTKLKFFRW